jgi:hypothetical protein
MSILGPLKEKVTQYVSVYVRLFKIDFIGRTANVMSYFIFTLIAMFIVFCILLFTGLGLVEVFITAFGASKAASFFLTIGTYFLLLLLVVGLRRPITRFFSSAVIKVMTKGDEDEDENDDEE